MELLVAGGDRRKLYWLVNNLRRQGEGDSMSETNHSEEVVNWLEQRGHTADEIKKIQAELTAYDQKIVRDALFDATSSGSFDINAIIKDALKSKR